MKKITSSILLTLIALFLVSSVQAQLISASDFMDLRKSDKNMVVVDCNKEDVYGKAHIMNAVNVPHTSLYKEGEVEGLIKSPEELAKIFGENGVNNENTIVLYDDGSNKYTSRVYWVLDYLGADNVMILHKDMDLWKKSRVPLTRSKTNVKPTTFTPKVNESIIVSTDFVKNNISDPNVLVFDSRDLEEYNGTSEKSDGHIKGALHLNYKDLLDENGAFKSKDELESIASKHGITKDKTTVFYCLTSVRAAAGYVAFAEILGYPNIKVYDGAYNEWVARGLPIE